MASGPTNWRQYQDCLAAACGGAVPSGPPVVFAWDCQACGTENLTEQGQPSACTECGAVNKEQN